MDSKSKRHQGGSDQPPSRNGRSAGNGRSEKRGRDRSEEAGPSNRPEKVAKVNAGPSGKGKRRDEFVDQPRTRAPNLDKHVPATSASGSTLVKMKANFFKVRPSRNASITYYRLDFEPVTEIFGLRRFLVNQHKATLGGLVYDGANQIYLMNPLQGEQTTLTSTSREGQEYTLTLRSPREILFTEGIFLQVYNIVTRNALRGLNLQLVGRNLFDANAAIAVPNHRLQLWPGYETSMRQHEHDLLLCCEIRHKVMRDENVLNIIRGCMERHGDYREAAARKIIGITIITRYNNKTYRISDIDWDQTPSSTFPTKTGEMSFVEYYSSKHGQQIRDMNQPLLVSKASARNIRAGQSEYILLIPELCNATGITDEMRSNFKMMRELSDFTRLDPTKRMTHLNEFNSRLRRTAASMQVFQENGLRLDENLIEFEARRLQQEQILFGAERCVNLARNDKADWTSDLQKIVMFNEVMTKKLRKWYYVFPSRNSRDADQFLRSFMQAAHGLCGRGFAEPERIGIRDDNIMTYTKTLETIFRNDPSFIMIVVSSNRSDLYGAIKRLTLCDRKPVPVQVIVEKTMKQSRIMSIATKVAIQVNCKLGGIPWTCKSLPKNLLVIGFSVTHDTSNKNHSYGAIVASLNPEENGGKFYSSITKHDHGEQVSANFGVRIFAILKKYGQIFNTVPKGILIYRDGVGDGQIQQVIDQELSEVTKTVKNFYDSYNKNSGVEAKEANIGFVIINKKTNTRLFRQERGRNAYGNPLPGTCVDDVITLPERYDFYLVSPSTGQGSVAPTYYNVIHDGFLKGRPDLMQKLTFKFCHLYYNWSGTTCVPSVVQYAKKLALLVGQHMHQVPNISEPIDKTLYFL